MFCCFLFVCFLIELDYLIYFFYFVSFIQPTICHYNQGKLCVLSGDLDNIFYTDGAVRHYLSSQSYHGWLFLLVTSGRHFQVAYKDGWMEESIMEEQGHAIYRVNMLKQFFL